MRFDAMLLLTATLLLAACSGADAPGPAPVSGPYTGASSGSSGGGYGR